MLTWNIETITTNLVETLLPRFTEEIALSITWKFSCGDTNKTVEFLFYRPNNYTKVFVREQTGVKTWGGWTFRCDHDSCWRTDGLKDIFQNYLDVQTKGNKDKSSPKEVDIQPDNWNPFLKFYKINIQPVPEERYTQEITELTHIPEYQTTIKSKP